MGLVATLQSGALLGGCAPVLRGATTTCPQDTDETGGVDWIPSVLHPVFYGYQDLGEANGVPRFDSTENRVRIWYPSHDGAPLNAPILKLCVARWPLVLFLHGQPPGQPPCLNPDYYQHWFWLPMTLARSGYVVVVPAYTAEVPETDVMPFGWPFTVVDWVRRHWENATWVDQRPESTATVGHSYGALRAVRAALARPQISAVASLGANWTDLGGTAERVLRSIRAPSFFMWKPGSEDLDAANGLWNVVSAPKYGAEYRGEHFDYISDEPNCDEPRGTCTAMERAAAELVALFISRFTPVRVSEDRINRRIPLGLLPAPVVQTDRQKFYSGGHLTADGCLQTLNWLSTDGQCTVGVPRDKECRINLRWAVSGVEGSRIFGG